MSSDRELTDHERLRAALKDLALVEFQLLEVQGRLQMEKEKNKHLEQALDALSVETLHAKAWADQTFDGTQMRRKIAARWEVSVDDGALLQMRAGDFVQEMFRRAVKDLTHRLAEKMLRIETDSALSRIVITRPVSMMIEDATQ